ncbi:hypothetical protein [Mangrovibrevibacter kandeliae]|uniref:hypothetical protein n=1 Tax=Mangrovibrevibacter kandeliae TaxID=2968473 RepID=UPI002118E768|nr:hypothetical protein [Aurantimonas sp. CSK15Z-1]MCQ8781718.1 hypothetical protein [Aurantimonas sp. CSK15Z-1]
MDDVVSPEGRAKRLADVARAEVDIARQTNNRVAGAEVPFDQYVDGRKGAPVETVRAGGLVFAEWRFLGEVLQWISAALVAASPVRSGRFSQSHLLIIDDVEYDPKGALPETFDEAVFVNSQPYARKLERGLSAQAPQGVFQAVAAVADRRFGNLADVRFSFRPLTGASALNNWAERTTMFKVGRRRMSDRERHDWLRRQPSISVRSY